MQATSRDWLNLIITATPVPDFAAQAVEVSLSPDQFNPTTDWFLAEHTAEGLRLMIGPGTQLEGGPGSLAPGSWHAWGRIVDMGDGTLPVFYIGAFLIEGGTDLAPMPPVTIGQAALDAAINGVLPGGLDPTAAALVGSGGAFDLSLKAASRTLVSDDIGDTGTAIGGATQTAIEASLAEAPTVVSAAAAAAAAAVDGLDVVTTSMVDAEPEPVSAEFTDVDDITLYWMDGLTTPTPYIRRGDTVHPSGDPTGVLDSAAAEAALAAHDRVVMAPGSWYLSDPLMVRSGQTLVLQGPATYLLAAGSNCNLITNVIGETTCTDIRVIADGTVVLDGNGVNQTRNTGAGWMNVGVNLVNVDGFLIDGITIRNTAMFGGLTVGCRNGLWRGVTVEQDKLVPNQDGIDVGPGCSFIRIENMRGVTEDDVHSIFGKYSTSQNTVHPLYVPGGALYSAAGNDTHDIYVTGSHVDAGKNFFRLQAAEGSQLYNIRSSDIVHTGSAPCRSLAIFGEMLAAYIDAPPATDGSDLHDITMDGFAGRVLSLVYADSYFRDAVIRNSHLLEWGSLVNQRDNTDAPAQFARLTIDGVTSSATDPGDVGSMITLGSGMVATDLVVRNAHLPLVTRVVTNSGGNLVNADIEAHIGGSVSPPFYRAGGTDYTGRVDIRSDTAVADWGTVPTLPAGRARRTNEV